MESSAELSSEEMDLDLENVGDQNEAKKTKDQKKTFKIRMNKWLKKMSNPRRTSGAEPSSEAGPSGEAGPSTVAESSTGAELSIRLPEYLRIFQNLDMDEIFSSPRCTNKMLKITSV